MSIADPEVLYARLAAGDAGRIASAADPITGAISAVGRAGESVVKGAQTAVSSWTGDAATKFGARGELSATAARAAGERLGAGVDILQAASRAYGQMRSAADNAIDVWRSRPPGLDEDQTRQLATQVNDSLTKVKTSYEGVLRSYAGALGKITPGFGDTAMSDCGWGRAAERGGSLPPVPPPGTDPKAVADWWKSLTPEQQAELQRTKYQELGQLRGLPAKVLDEANRARITEDKDRFAKQSADLKNQIAERAKELGVDPNTEDGRNKLMNDPKGSELIAQQAEAQRRATNAANAAHEVENADKLAKNPAGKQAFILYYSPDGPGAKEGAMAVAYGNPDDAKNLAVCVPGTTSRLGESGFAQNQAAELSGAMGAEGVAIQWLGYDAPEFSLGQVNDPAQAKEGAAILAQDVNGYKAANTKDAHVTVIGHSYGSTVVGYAAKDHGLAADDIAFVGSPGVGASSVDQLSAGRGHVYVGATEHDPVVQGTSGDWFTEDGSSTGPYDSKFGAKTFGTPDGTGIGGAHSQYYAHGSESLDNLAKIATGHGDQVTSQRWQDSPTPRDVVPGSDLPIAGPVIDWGTNTVKEVADIGEDVWHGGGQVVDDVSHGDFGAAAGHAWDTTKEVASDVGDWAVDTVGNVGELGRDVYEGGKAVVEGGVEVVKDAGGAIADGAKSVYDNTIGSWF
ncbi:hypothetical protein Lesp02_36840 [Lentzea sp. NBRC 105346]|uniref:alpha/beta hydrolase n=1 Tax=Lentzea sp. NBRC 105346 TaxID=3032205 RepID=UPI0024A2ABD4|nr:alpha/beta hydrolase [Lentzea sp. NBRC 105346]GLZ31496.1 hypothetical protein Lesp02_36840 [Lentzea sp. NBRC 105346]